MTHERTLLRRKPAVIARPTHTFQRTCACGQHKISGEKCERCRQQNGILRRDTVDPATTGSAPAVVQEVLRAPGRALDASVRGVMEPGLGRDLGQVRVHEGAQPDASARAVGARAYAVGHHVVFRDGAYAPHTWEGRWLLAHELAHTVQQQASLHAKPEPIRIGADADPAEREADRAADSVMSGEKASITGDASQLMLRREPAQLKRGKDVHKAIQKHFKANAKGGEAFTELRIPGGSTTHLRKGEDGKPTGNAGRVDLAVSKGKNDRLLLGELKSDDPGQVALGCQAINHYIDMARKAGQVFPVGGGPLPISTADGMGKTEYLPTGPIQVDASQDVVANWNSRSDCKGLLVYTLVASNVSGPGSTSQSPATASGGGSAAQTAAGKPKAGWPSAILLANFIVPEKLIRDSGGRIEFQGRYARPIGKQALQFGPFTVAYDSAENHLTVPRVTVRGGQVPYLSPIESITIQTGKDGLEGSGLVRSNLPLLNQAAIQVSIHGNNVALSLKGNAASIKPPIPGLHVTQADLGVQLSPELAAQGTIGVAFGPNKARPYVDGVLTVSADENGLAAKGDVHGHLPGLKHAEGKVLYANGELTGSLNLKSASIAIPGVKVNAADVSLAGSFDSTEGLSVKGQVHATMPGDNRLTLTAARSSEGEIILSGEAALNIPKIDKTKIDLTYDGEHLTGSVQAKTKIAGQPADVKIEYRDGELTGSGEAAVKAGKATGKVKLHLSEEHKLSGSGTIQYPLTDRLVGELGVEVPEDGPIRATGEIMTSKPVVLFDGKSADITFFTLHETFPVPGLSLPLVGGVIVDIRGSLGANYTIGPGMVENLVLAGSVNLSEANPNPELHGHATARIPASAGLTLTIEGGAGIGNRVVSATGGFQIKGAGGIRAEAASQVAIDYKDRRFTIDADASVRAGLNLTITLTAYVQAELDAVFFKKNYRKDWNLAGFQWQGGQVALSMPVHYASDEPFHLPAAKDIKTEPPGLDARGLLMQLFTSAKSNDDADK